MTAHDLAQKIFNNADHENFLQIYVDAFLVDRTAQNLTPGTVRFYRAKLHRFLEFCSLQGVTRVDEVTADTLRKFLVWLADTGHTSGGVHGFYRSVKAFMRWYWQEVELAVQNPITKVKAPRQPEEPLEPVAINTIQAMINVCGTNIIGLRDTALFLIMLDTGLRAAELLSLDRSDVNLVSGEVTVRQGKGRKPRSVYLGSVARKAIRRYLNACTGSDKQPVWLWQTDDGDRLTYGGLRSVLERRAERAGVPVPTAHDFRRAFALNCLRAGMDVYSLQMLMGHKDLSILRRYLAQTNSDLQIAHASFSPADRMKKK